VNLNQLPVNRPSYYYNPSRRNGSNNVMNYGSIPNYIQSRFAPKIVPASQYLQLVSHEEWAGTVTEFQSVVTDYDFGWPRAAWEVLGLQQGQQGQQENFVSNVAGSLSGATSQVRQQTYCKFTLRVCGSLAATDNDNRGIPQILILILAIDSTSF
jgi:catalase